MWTVSWDSAGSGAVGPTLTSGAPVSCGVRGVPLNMSGGGTAREGRLRLPPGKVSGHRGRGAAVLVNLTR